jgi:hypothetical protein
MQPKTQVMSYTNNPTTGRYRPILLKKSHPIIAAKNHVAEIEICPHLSGEHSNAKNARFLASVRG